ncbi:hypothetical protein RF11_03714 [Thelohanellus kitauei]|uniref:Uncharacterized protein n=1 Tax=Thelohanellus kitauei TaxID=669202 RepID=A0A0C2N4N4_THEKT|nr:hypothetical protein RF11_03714 [Thelohanellus kitauei]
MQNQNKYQQQVQTPNNEYTDQTIQKNRFRVSALPQNSYPNMLVSDTNINVYQAEVSAPNNDNSCLLVTNHNDSQLIPPASSKNINQNLLINANHPVITPELLTNTLTHKAESLSNDDDMPILEIRELTLHNQSQ